MRSLILFVVAASLIGQCASEDIPDVESPDTPALPKPNVCSDFGNEFCGDAKCEVVPGKTDAFVCKCERNDTYYSAAERKCSYKRTCKNTECAVGMCTETGPNRVACACPDAYPLSLNCKIRGEFVDDCKKKGGTAMLRKEWYSGAKCDCGKWAVMDRNKSKCVPTTCLRPDLTCKELCEKKLLEKDNRCCQGWNSADCSVAPEDGTYCSPGSIMTKDGKCQDACTAKEAKFVCANGCTKTEGSAGAYECKCERNQVVAEDGITCKAVRTTRECSDEEKKSCLPSETCHVEKNKAICACQFNQQLVDGECTDRCTENKCHERFMDCTVYMGQQGCLCPWRVRQPGEIYINDCILRHYYYTVSLTPNISLDVNNCNWYEGHVLEAIRTIIGKEVFKVEILNCAPKIKARLIAVAPLSKYLLKRLQTCEHPEGDLCMLYPKLPIKKDSATEIEEENLCDSLLKVQEQAYNGQNECVMVEDFFWFKCAPGYRAVDQITKGRLRRSVCESGMSCSHDKELECANKGEICVYENQESKCQCPPGTVAGQAGCSARTTCNAKERRECQDKRRQCVFEDQKAECKCPQGTVDVGHGCYESCSEEDSNKCIRSGQRCVMENQKAVCKETSTTPATTEGNPEVTESCNEEESNTCRSSGQRCVIENRKAVCKGMSTTPATTDGNPDPGPSSAVSVSSATLLLLATVIAAAAA